MTYITNYSLCHLPTTTHVSCPTEFTQLLFLHPSASFPYHHPSSRSLTDSPWRDSHRSWNSIRKVALVMKSNFATKNKRWLYLLWIPFLFTSFFHFSLFFICFVFFFDIFFHWIQFFYFDFSFLFLHPLFTFFFGEFLPFLSSSCISFRVLSWHLFPPSLQFPVLSSLTVLLLDVSSSINGLVRSNANVQRSFSPYFVWLPLAHISDQFLSFSDALES